MVRTYYIYDSLCEWHRYHGERQCHNSLTRSAGICHRSYIARLRNNNNKNNNNNNNNNNNTSPCPPADRSVRYRTTYLRYRSFVP
ncbi:hypothetical protein ACFW04_003395 [Cataglyphis niger]